MNIHSIEATKVWLEDVTGPREILPESLWTGITREGHSGRGWAAAIRRAEEDKTHNDAGIWLPSLDASERDLMALQDRLHASAHERATQTKRQKRLLKSIGAIAITDTGCWESDGDVTVQEVAELDTRSPAGVLEGDEHLSELRHCSNEACVYHRHFDLTFGVPSNRRRLLYPNLDHFVTADNGSVLTSWGDRLPSLASSRAHLRELQLRCIPFVDNSTSVLSALKISQISIIPATGCWFSNNYAMAPAELRPTETWQYDAYSRLSIPQGVLANYDPSLGNAKLGHRVIWRLTHDDLPDKLNHRCGFRPCVNPGHLEPISGSANMLHASLMSTAVQMVAQVLPISQGVRILRDKLTALHLNPDLAEEFWTHKSTL